MARKPRKEESLPDAGRSFGSNPFGALKAKFPGAPDRSPQPAASKKRPSPTTPRSRVIVRRELKGRRGKTMTRIQGLNLKAAELDSLSRDMKRALGCGATVDGDDLLLQGELIERASAWLRAHGRPDVRAGN